MTIYLDYNATAPLRPEVQAVVAEAMAAGALNASSVHRAGRLAKQWLEEARGRIAECINCFPNELIFTASGSEANNLALHALRRTAPDCHVFASAIEHSSILKPLEALGEGKSTLLPVTVAGVVDLAALEERLVALKTRGAPALVSVMLANNETGVIQPVAEVVRLARQYGAWVHCDAVQAPGKIPLDVASLGADMLSIAAHKLGGPLGAAALAVRSDLAIAPLIHGGGQELGRRAGTENIPAIRGFARAMELACDASAMAHMAQLAAWRDAMEAALTAEGAVIIGQNAPRLPNTSAIAMPGARAETQLMHCDLSGIAVSAGSACSSGRIAASHVMAAMHVAHEVAESVIRVSLGWATKEADLHTFMQAWRGLKKRLSTAA